MEIIAIINRKGGVGKTATAHALGSGLLRKGYKVLFIDMDSQTNLSHSMKASTDENNSFSLLTGQASAAQAIQNTAQGDIIAGSESLAGADITITGTGKEYKLREALEKIRGKYDYIIIDTPAALGTLTINALTAANSVVIPVQAEIYSLQGIGQLYGEIQTVKKYCNAGLTIRGILLTRYNSRSILARDMQGNLLEAAKHIGTRLYKAPIRECSAIKEAAAMQQDIFTYAPRSNGAKDYAELVNEFLKGGNT